MAAPILRLRAPDKPPTLTSRPRLEGPSEWNCSHLGSGGLHRLHARTSERGPPCVSGMNWEIDDTA